MEAVKNPKCFFDIEIAGETGKWLLTITTVLLTLTDTFLML